MANKTLKFSSLGDIEFFKRVCEQSPVPVIVSGGVSSLTDLERLSSLRTLRGVIVGKALYEGRVDLEEAVRVVG